LLCVFAAVQLQTTTSGADLVWIARACPIIKYFAYKIPGRKYSNTLVGEAILGGDNLIALVENCRHLEALELIARGIGRETTETILRMVSEGEEDSFALNEIELIGYPFRIHNTVSKGW
jgi:hypothetical protein